MPEGCGVEYPFYMELRIGKDTFHSGNTGSKTIAATSEAEDHTAASSAFDTSFQQHTDAITDGWEEQASLPPDLPVPNQSAPVGESQGPGRVKMEAPGGQPPPQVDAYKKRVETKVKILSETHGKWDRKRRDWRRIIAEADDNRHATNSTVKADLSKLSDELDESDRLIMDWEVFAKSAFDSIEEEHLKKMTELCENINNGITEGNTYVVAINSLLNVKTTPIKK